MFLASIKNAVATRIAPDSPIWFALRKASRLLPSSARPTFSIQGILRSFSQNVRDVFFLQIGSFDGINNDPIHDFVVENQWAGLLVEPIKESYDRLLDTYKENPLLRFENVAIAETEGVKQFWRLERGADSASWHEQLSSFRRDVILTHANLIPDIESRLVSEDVRCVTIASLVHKHSVKRIDLLHIDAEGYDFEIIKTFNFDMFLPAIVLYEHTHLSSADKFSCAKYLRGKGYKLFEEGTDSIAFL